MSENLKKFLEAVSKDENLREKAEAFVKNADKEQAIAAAINLAKQLGIELAEADFEAPEEEISEEELAVVSGGNLYNRCHLIGFQLTGENANKKNLITGTRYMNWDGMVEFENMIADYVKETGNHVMYRVTPMFYENELVARGVHMEAYSVEDNGEGISFNVYAYNVQPGITIDYATGESWLSGEEGGNAGNEETPDNNSGEEGPKYILNTSSKKVHIPTCGSVSTMVDKNKQEYNGELADILSQGYAKCGACNAGE